MCSMGYTTHTENIHEIEMYLVQVVVKRRQWREKGMGVDSKHEK